MVLTPPFFCVHGAGGHVLGFNPLAQHLGQDQPLYGLEAPGRDEEQEPLTGLEELASHYIAEIRAVQPKGPYHLGGAAEGVETYRLPTTQSDMLREPHVRILAERLKTCLRQTQRAQTSTGTNP